MLIILAEKSSRLTGARTRDLRQHRLVLNTNALALFDEPNEYECKTHPQLTYM
jgi:hypothetical protein